jgi:hypothetical protein
MKNGLPSELSLYQRRSDFREKAPVEILKKGTSAKCALNNSR